MGQDWMIQSWAKQVSFKGELASQAFNSVSNRPSTQSLLANDSQLLADLNTFATSPVRLHGKNTFIVRSEGRAESHWR